MSATIWNGESRSLSIETGKKLTVAAMSGTYSVLTTAGAGAGTALASNAMGGTYGPYAGPITVLLSSSSISEIDYDVAVTPVIESDTFVKASKSLTGGNQISIGDNVLPLNLRAKVSGSVRGHIQFAANVVSAGSNTLTHRTADYSVVQCDHPVIELWNGYVPGLGAHGSARELGTGGSTVWRYALLTGVSGTAANQSSATVWKATFFGMLSEPEFKAAGGTVSTDGFTITVPDTIRFRTDPIFGLRLSALQKYFHQTEISYTTGANRISGWAGQSAQGDMRLVSADASANTVYSKDFSAGTTVTASTFYPMAVIGIGDGGARSKIVGLEGDSIINGDNDSGGTYGERGAIRRALIAGGYSFVDVSVPGTNMNDMMLYGGWRVRMGLLSEAYAVITDHGHNERGILTPSFTANVLPVIKWHNGILRASAKPGAKLARTTLLPHTNSSDSWVTTANQTYKEGDSDPATGWVAEYGDYVMRRGAYAAAFLGLQEPDAGLDFAGLIGTTPFAKWPVNGTANWATADGTHPSTALHTLTAPLIQPLLPTLIGF